MLERQLPQAEHRHSRPLAHSVTSSLRGRHLAFAATLGLWGAAACSGEPARPERAALPVGHEAVLHVAEVEGQRLEFVSLAADAASEPIHTVISTLHRGKRELVGALFDHYGPLTMLEVFNAVAPFDEAPAEIARTHASEARAIGRTSADVLDVDLDWVDPLRPAGEAGPLELTDKALPPGSVDECRDIVFENTPAVTWSRITINPHSSPSREFSSAAFMCVGGRQDFFTEPGLNICSDQFFSNPRTRAAICHFDPASEETAIQIGGSREGSDMSYSSPRVILFEDINISTFFPSGPQRNAIVNFPPAGTYAYILGTALGNEP